MNLTDQPHPERRGVPLTKKPTKLPAPRGRRLTLAAGWIALVFGLVHVIVAPLESRSRDVWSDAADDGWWNSFTLEDPTTLAELERSERFWVTLGSWGAPLLVLGALIVWSTRQGHRVPAWLGWIMLAWGLVFVTALPASPGWLLPLIGALIIAGDRRGRRAAPLPRAHASRPQAKAA
jgi:Family of unknown function (DUF6463)